MSQWIEWKGGECPVAGDVRVEVRIPSGERFELFAKNVIWRHDLSDETGNVVAYRVVAPLETGAPSASPAATPRTDELFQRHVAEQREMRPGISYVVTQELAIRQVKELLDFARTLKREVAELRGKLDEAQAGFDGLLAHNQEVAAALQAAESALATAKKDERERCAKVCEASAMEFGDDFARLIRNLKEEA